MSTKSTLLLTPCCHIYTDCIDDTLCIDVSYGSIDEVNNDHIEVHKNSDFANLMKDMINKYNGDK
ncbi:MAG: hypothetical protein COA43_14805 [Robiginitomaculum sp.]|nr:MAG: hypothetical protein COA43_14805 [Robiginitomaculum sp.]